jgi:hypothetical protein
MNKLNEQLTPEEEADFKRLEDFLVSATILIRGGWTVKELQKELAYYGKEEEQICERLTDSQREVLNNNPDAYPIAKKDIAGNVMEVVIAEPIPTNEHPDKAIITRA